MSQYRDRTGQRIGSLEVLEDHARTKRPRQGGRKVIWRCHDHATGRDRYLRTEKIIRMDRAAISRDNAL